MPLDTSIENVGEYYSSHYLESTFAKDTRELLRRWKEESSGAVPRRIQRLGRQFFRAKEQALEIDEPRRRLKSRRDALRSWHGLFLDALGYTRLEPEDFPVDGGARFVPVLGRLERFGQPWLVVCETAFCLPDGSLPDGAPSENPFDLRPLRCQLVEAERTLFSNDWGRACARVLTAEDAPRWLLLLAGSRVCLLDRNTYAQGRYLAFEVEAGGPSSPPTNALSSARTDSGAGWVRLPEGAASGAGFNWTGNPAEDRLGVRPASPGGRPELRTCATRDGDSMIRELTSMPLDTCRTNAADYYTESTCATGTHGLIRLCREEGNEILREDARRDRTTRGSLR